MSPIPWFIAGFVALAVIVIVGAIVRERRRAAAMEQVAAQIGLAYAKRDDTVLQRGLGPLALFSKGRRRRTRNVMTGKIEDLDLVIFDYQYTVGGGKNSRTYRQTVVAFGHGAKRLPSFSLQPEGFFQKIASGFGYQDIDFETHPAFSARYLLRGDDEEAIRRIFTPEILEHFEHQKRLCVGAAGEWMAIYRAGRKVKPDEVGAFLDEAFTLCNMLA